MRKLIILFFLLSILPLISSMNVNLNFETTEGVMVAGIDKPATFDLKITNLDRIENLRFLNFEGFNMEPQTLVLEEDKTENILFKVYPKDNFDYRGFYIFKFSMANLRDEVVEKELVLRIIDFEDAFEIGSEEINPESNSLEVYIRNKENFDFGEVRAKFSSAFFNLEEDFTLGPKEKKSFNVKLNKEDFKELMAGFYTLNADVTSEDQKAKLEGIIKFAEKDILTTTKKDYGLIISSKIIRKENVGNVLAESESVIKKNIISRLFTTFSPEPNMVERQGTKVYYTWNEKIKPGETLEIVIKTNWLFPLVLIFFIISTTILAKQYSKTNLVMRKKVSFVRAKGGEFALKVTIHIHAKKYLERINIIDRLPPLVKVYERFGIEKPVKVDEKNKKIEWAFEKLEEGETRAISYIIYSKVGVLGRFALPEAVAIFEREGKIQESASNRTFFVAEQKK